MWAAELPSGSCCAAKPDNAVANAHVTRSAGNLTSIEGCSAEGRDVLSAITVEVHVCVRHLDALLLVPRDDASNGILLLPIRPPKNLERQLKQHSSSTDYTLLNPGLPGRKSKQHKSQKGLLNVS